MFNLTNYNPDSNKKIVFRCNSQGFGGVGDRFIGLCSSYVLSLILDYEFRIYWTYPIKLNELLDEKNVKWNLEDYDINNICNTGIQLNFLDDNLDTKTKYVLENHNDLKSLFNKSMIIISNKPFYLYLLNNTHLKERFELLNISNKNNIIYNCMSILFAMKNETQLKYNKMLNVFSKYYTIGIQIRSFIGEFFDELDETKLKSYYNFIENNYETYGSKLLVFLCSDSKQIIEHITTKYSYINFILTEHSIIHLERSTENNNDIQNNLKLILELYSLGKTRKLMITNSSNFGRLGSLISKKIPYINGNNTYELTSFENILTKDRE